MAYDTRPLLTLDEKQRLLQDAVKHNFILYFEHDPIVSMCSLQQTERGIREKDVLNLSDLA
jgi:hypothetical protein